MTGCRDEPPTAGSPRLRWCSLSSRDRRFALVRGRYGPGSARTSTELPRRVDREEAEAEQAAELVGTAVAVTSAAGGPHREPDLVGSGEAVDPLQDQLQRQSELELGDDQEGRLTGPDGDDVAAADLALRLVAEPLEMCLDRGIERGLGHAARTRIALVPRHQSPRDGSVRLGLASAGRCATGRAGSPPRACEPPNAAS